MRNVAGAVNLLFGAGLHGDTRKTSELSEQGEQEGSNIVSLYITVLYCAVLYCTVLYCMYFIVKYIIVLASTVLYCNV